MTANQFLGLFKFFKNEEHLDALVGGVFHCNTPEYYRQSRQEGISDKHESCVHAYRQSRGDEKYQIVINGHILEGLVNFTIHGGNRKDSWLHCWMALEFPEDENAISLLCDDLQRAREDFGYYYAFLPAHKLDLFVSRLRTVIPLDVRPSKVIYSDNNLDWSAACKSTAYKYQREYRFIVGECDHTCVEPRQFEDNAGFSEYILKSPEVKIVAGEDNYVMFSINGNEVIAHNKKINARPK